MQLRNRMQRGDTIVEVLISIAIVGIVLGGAYAVIDSNTRNNQAAGERTSAVKVAESQLELLRSYAGSNSALPTGNFCMYTTPPPASSVEVRDIPSPLLLPSPTNGGYPSECTVDDGVAVDRYVAGIHANGGNGFTVYVNWDGATGSRSQVSIAYKVYP